MRRFTSLMAVAVLAGGLDAGDIGYSIDNSVDSNDDLYNDTDDSVDIVPSSTYTDTDVETSDIWKDHLAMLEDY